MSCGFMRWCNHEMYTCFLVVEHCIWQRFSGIYVFVPTHACVELWQFIIASDRQPPQMGFVFLTLLYFKNMGSFIVLIVFIPLAWSKFQRDWRRGKPWEPREIDYERSLERVDIIICVRGVLCEFINIYISKRWMYINYLDTRSLYKLFLLPYWKKAAI